MGDLLAQTVPLALAAAISPLVLMGILAILGGPHATARGAAYALGVIATTAALLALGLIAVERLTAGPGGGPLSSPWASAATGVLLVGFAALLVRPRRGTDREQAERHHRRLIRPDSPPLGFALLGAVLMVVNLSTIVVLFTILRNVARADQPLVDDIVAMAIVAVITTVPAWGPLVLVLAGGRSMADRIGRLGQWTNRNARYILGALFLVFGLQDLLKALGH